MLSLLVFELRWLKIRKERERVRDSKEKKLDLVESVDLYIHQYQKFRQI